MSDQPWTPKDATKKIRACAKRQELALSYTFAASSQIASRNLISGDVLHLLKNGTVFDAAEKASRAMYKYAVEGDTPNSDGRSVRMLVISDGRFEIKILSVKWRDENVSP